MYPKFVVVPKNGQRWATNSANFLTDCYVFGTWIDWRAYLHLNSFSFMRQQLLSYEPIYFAISVGDKHFDGRNIFILSPSLCKHFRKNWFIFKYK